MPSHLLLCPKDGKNTMKALSFQLCFSNKTTQVTEQNFGVWWLRALFTPPHPVMVVVGRNPNKKKKWVRAGGGGYQRQHGDSRGDGR